MKTSRRYGRCSANSRPTLATASPPRPGRTNRRLGEPGPRSAEACLGREPEGRLLLVGGVILALFLVLPAVRTRTRRCSQRARGPDNALARHVDEPEWLAKAEPGLAGRGSEIPAHLPSE